MTKSTKATQQQKYFKIYTTINFIFHVFIFAGDIIGHTNCSSESSYNSTQIQIPTPPFTLASKSKENLKFTREETAKRIISTLGRKNEIKPLDFVLSPHVLEKVEANSLVVVGLDDEKNKDVSRTRRRTQFHKKNQKPLRLHNENHNNKGAAIYPRAKRSLIIEDAEAEVDAEGKEKERKSLIDTIEENIEEQLLQAQLLQSTIKVFLRDPCNNSTLICAGEFVNCINGYCKCVEGYVPRPDNRDLCGERILYNIETPQTDPTMIAFVVCLCLMSVTLCVVLRLFAKARFRENRTIFNTPNPRLMNVSLLKDSKKLIRGSSAPSGPRSPPQSPFNDDDGARDSLNSNQGLCGIETGEAQDQEEELLETQEPKQTYPFNKPIENEQRLSQDLPSGTSENPIKSARHKFFTGEDKSGGSRKNLYRYKQDSVTSNTAV